MQSSLLVQQRSAGLATSRQCVASMSGGNGHVARPTSSRTPAPRRPDVQVAAKRGGGRPMMPGQQMQMAQPQTPKVDPDNAEFVVFLRGRNYMEGKLEVKEGRWLPLSVVKGGPAANYLIKAMESEWGRKLYGKTLLRQIGMAIYRDREKIEQNIRESYPPFAKLKSKNFEYAFKIRDKSNPKAWIRAENITIFPPEEKMGGNAMDALSKLFNAESIAKMFSGSA